MDLAAFYAAYRADGRGRAAHDPAMMVALLLYAYAIGERSSRRIERRCVEDVAFRVIAANQAPDHATIARFRRPPRARRWPSCSARCWRCARRPGWCRSGWSRSTARRCTPTRRSTRTATTSRSRARSSRRPRGRRAEDELFGERARRRAAAGAARPREGRQRWLREAKRRLDEQRAEEARPIPRSRAEAAAWRPSAASRRSSTSSAARTPPTRPTARAG